MITWQLFTNLFTNLLIVNPEDETRQTLSRDSKLKGLVCLTNFFSFTDLPVDFTWAFSVTLWKMKSENQSKSLVLYLYCSTGNFHGIPYWRQGLRKTLCWKRVSQFSHLLLRNIVQLLLNEQKNHLYDSHYC